MKKLLQEELEFRKRHGLTPVTLDEVKARLAELGYKLNRQGDSRSLARYMTGERAGCSYPSLTTWIEEANTGLSFAHVDARRDANFDRLLAMRQSGEVFAVVGEYILDL